MNVSRGLAHQLDAYHRSGAAGASGLKMIATTGTYSPTSAAPIIATFTNTLSAFSILGLNVGANGMRIDAFDTGGNLLTFAQAFGLDAGETNHPSLSITRAQGDIKSIRFYQPNAVVIDGMLWDNMTYRVANTSVVPEPSTYAMMTAGLLAVGLIRRRRKA